MNVLSGSDLTVSNAYFEHSNMNVQHSEQMQTRRSSPNLLCLILRVAGFASVCFLYWYKKRKQVEAKIEKEIQDSMREHSIHPRNMSEAYSRLLQRFKKEGRSISFLLESQNIPQELHIDRWLTIAICPITQAPIRSPVLDPNQRTVYEPSAIIQWLNMKRSSPVTRKYLNWFHLEPQPVWKSLIDARLRFHEEQLRRYQDMQKNQVVKEPAITSENSSFQ